MEKNLFFLAYVSLGVHVVALSKICKADWLAIGGEGVQPQPFLVRATLSSFSEPPRNPRPSIIMCFKVSNS